MQRFRSGHLQLLVATDVAARGLDVSDLSHIINYNLPDDPEVYIHRSGRTGRAGKHGISISITHSREGRRIKELEKIVGKPFKYLQIPGGREICETRLLNLIDRVEKVKVDESQIASFLPAIYKKLSWLDREELIKHFVSVEFNRFLEYYKDAGDLNVMPEKGRDAGKKKQGKTTFTRMYINLGNKVGMNPSHLIGLINEALNRNDVEIGKIDVQRNFSFFEIDRDYDQETLKAFENTVYEDTRINIDISEGEMRGDRSRPPRNRVKKSYPQKGQDYKKKNYQGNKGRKKR
ncbi:MAG: C-terminal helicase domain-containing protein [Marinilabiliaceae bacterium]|jgi:ATP-dependent RNA helicase DeaD|nr:C-terminal helicase domain-containing protein [Marinilabiliaceae bacterium]